MRRDSCVKYLSVSPFVLFSSHVGLRSSVYVVIAGPRSAIGRARKSGVLVRYPVWQHTFVSPSAFSRRAVVSYW